MWLAVRELVFIYTDVILGRCQCVFFVGIIMRLLLISSYSVTLPGESGPLLCPV